MTSLWPYLDLLGHPEECLGWALGRAPPKDNADAGEVAASKIVPHTCEWRRPSLRYPPATGDVSVPRWDGSRGVVDGGRRWWKGN